MSRPSEGAEIWVTVSTTGLAPATMPVATPTLRRSVAQSIPITNIAASFPTTVALADTSSARYSCDQWLGSVSDDADAILMRLRVEDHRLQRTPRRCRGTALRCPGCARASLVAARHESVVLWP